MKKYLPFLIPSVVFLFIKLQSVGIRLSDTNIYFYTGYQLLTGNTLYKDVFFTNFPLLPYISALYFYLLNGNLVGFFFTAVIEVIIVGFLIYYIVLKKIDDVFLATLSTTLYLFSFIVLSTSDHQSGVFIASLFAVVSYLFFTKKKLFLSGIFIALALMTKAYFLPVFIALFVVIALKFLDKNRLPIVYFSTGCVITLFLIILPSAILAPEDFIRDVFNYSLTRSQGLSKINIASFFITHDILLFLGLVINILLIKKRFYFGLLSIFGILFFLLYKDVYYLYLNFFIPFLCISFAVVFPSIQKNLGLQKYILPSIIFLFVGYNLFTYINGFLSLEKIPSFNEIVSIVKSENPDNLYGVNDLTPAIAYFSDTKLLNDITDTNPNIFRKGYLNAKILSNDAVRSKTMLVAHGVDYPEFGVKQDIVDEIFDVNILKSCKLVKSYPVRTETYVNRVNLFRCF